MKTKFLHVRFKAPALARIIDDDRCNGVMFRLLKKSFALGDPTPVDPVTREKIGQNDWPRDWNWPAKDDDWVRDSKGCVILVGTPTYTTVIPNKENYVVIGENLPVNRKKNADYEYMENFPRKFNLMFFWKVQMEYLLKFDADIIMSGVMAFFGSDWVNYKNKRMRSRFFLMKAEPEIINQDPLKKNLPKSKSFHAFLSPLAPITEPFFQLSQPCPPEWDDGEGEV